MKAKVNTIIDDPSQVMEPGNTLQNDLLRHKNQQEERKGQSEENKVHIYLEDFTTYSPLNRKKNKELLKLYADLSFQMDQVSSTLQKIGLTYYTISGKCTDL